MINHGTLGYPIFRQTHTEPAEHHKKCQCFGPTWTKKLRCQKRNKEGHQATIYHWCCRNRLSAASKCPSGHASGASFRVTKLLEITVDGPPVMLRGINILRSFWHQDIEVAIYLGSKSWSCQLGGTYSSVQQPASYDSGTPNNIYTSKYKKMAGTHWP